MDTSPGAPPVQRFPVLHRERLIAALESHSDTCKILLVTAPAGYGKTTLLASWAKVSRYPLAWVSLANDDQGVESFFRSVLTAWVHVRPSVQTSEFGVLLSGMLPDLKSMQETFVRVAGEPGLDTVFVFDDFSRWQDAEITRTLSHLLERTPAGVRFIVSGRAESGIPVAGFRVRHELFELRADDLRFTRAEIEQFVRDNLDGELPAGFIEDLTIRSEGWAAGLQLVALARHRHRDFPDGVASPMQNRYIWDYLNEEVFDRLAASDRKFLTRISILDRLNGSLCTAVTGMPDGHHRLVRLERGGIFIQAMDAGREWFLVQDPFRTFLRDQLEQTALSEVPDLHRRAGNWYLEHDLPNAALRHAVAGGDASLASGVFERYAVRILTGGELSVFARWFEMLPGSWVVQNPRFELFQVVYLVFSGAIATARETLQKIQDRLASLEPPEQEVIKARLAAMHCLLACTVNDLPEALEYGRRALETLPETDLAIRSGIHHGLGDVLRQHGEWEQARQHYFAILDRPDDQAFSIRSVHAFGALADLELLQGNLRTANTYWQKALAAIRAPANFGFLPLPTISWVYIRMAELLYEWNQLDVAREHLEHGLERVDVSGDSRTMIAAYLMAGRLKLVDGVFDDVTRFVDRVRAIIETADFPGWKTRLDRLQVDSWLAQGRSDLARRWLTSAYGIDEVGGGADSIMNRLTCIKVIILTDDRGSFDQAGSDLRALLGSVAGQGLTGIMIEGRALLALLQWQRGDHAAALVELQRSMALAEPEGYAAVYADMGLPMAMLLQEARSRRVMPAYIDHLMQAFRSRAIVVPAGRALPEPLSPREVEILELLASGLSNREIAATIFISAETVKKHLANIYAKLDAHSRIDALVRARELGLVN